MQLPTRIRVVLCDADGNLFPSEEPAFVASAKVTNRFLAEHGVMRGYGAEELRLAVTGMSYRSVLRTVARANNVPALPPEVLEYWVQLEKATVTAHLRKELRPDPDVLGPLAALADRHSLAAVSSSADARIAASFEVTGMARHFPPERRFSAEDSLPTPISKPDPAIYLHALRALGVDSGEAVAVEDSFTGATSAVKAGITTIGNLKFVHLAEREERRRLLISAGVHTVVTSWAEIMDIVGH